MSTRQKLPKGIQPELTAQYLSALEGVETASVIWTQGELQAFVVVDSLRQYQQRELKADIAECLGIHQTPQEIHFSSALVQLRVA